MTRHQLLDEPITHSIIKAFFEVYNTLRHGLLEHLYVLALERELRTLGRRVAREVWVPVWYKGATLGEQRLDMLVDERVIVEVKSTDTLHRSALRQLYSYLHATRLQTGLLLHFGPEPKFYRAVWSGDGRAGRS